VQISATAYFWRQFYALLTSNSDSEQKKNICSRCRNVLKSHWLELAQTWDRFFKYFRRKIQRKNGVFDS
jgi:hypothetical protein